MATLPSFGHRERTPFMRHALPILAALALSACQPQAPDGKPAAAPADAPAPVAAAPAATDTALPDAFKGDLHVVGTEPFWSAQVREKEIAFSLMDPATRVTGPNNGAAMRDGKAVWESVVGGKPFMLTMTEQAGCSDGMSDLKFPLSAEIVYDGKIFKGCASKESERPREKVAP